jgi:hypothetical protein
MTPSRERPWVAYRERGGAGRGLSSVRQVPEPVSPRYRSRVPNCQAATGATVSRMYRDHTTRLVGKMSAFLPIRKGFREPRRGRNAICRGFCRPGWTRTSDTRFRNHTEGVLGGSQPCAIVLHGLRFWRMAVLACAWPCWAVSGRLVGIAAATLRASPRTLTAPVAKATSVSALLSTGSLLLSAA